MRIKTKLTLGIGLLLSLIAVLGAVSVFSVHALRQDARQILSENYQTLDYTGRMSAALDELQSGGDGRAAFREALLQQQKNVTEPGEEALTRQLTQYFEALPPQLTADPSVYRPIRATLLAISNLNLKAIDQKSDAAQDTARSSIRWILLSGLLCLSIAFGVLIRLPETIAGPVREFAASIAQITARNYTHRVNIGQPDEFKALAKAFNQMAQKLQEYENSSLSQLLFEKKRVEMLINKMHDPVIGLDEHNVILFANEEAIKALGMADAATVVGASAQQLAAHNDLLRSLLSATGQEEGSLIKIFAHGKESYFNKEIIPIDLTPTGEEAPRNSGSVIVLKNVTAFKELDFAKTNFIATISHELKTPIASIKLSLQLLENPRTGALNEAQLQLIQGIRDDSRRLLKITSELLNIAQVETGKIQLNIQQSKPADILQYALDAVKRQAEQQGVTLITEAPAALPAIKADGEKTAWVLINFLTNAIRYSPEGGQVRIRLSDTEAGVRFCVQDEGQGIDPRYQPRLFDKYFQAPGSRQSGSGLGLAISKEFIEAQGGAIGLISELGLGSQFFFILPAIGAAPAARF